MTVFLQLALLPEAITEGESGSTDQKVGGSNPTGTAILSSVWLRGAELELTMMANLLADRMVGHTFWAPFYSNSPRVTIVRRGKKSTELLGS